MDSSKPIMLGPYQLLERLAQGAYGEVYRARHIGPAGFQRILAIKRLKKHVMQDESAVKAFENEARIGGLLLHHNIAQTLGFGEANGEYYLAMEFVDGVSFQEIIRLHAASGYPIPLPVALELIEQACEGLHYAHEAKNTDGAPLKLIHRDIKPSNLMLTRNGVVKVMDFGIARVDNQNLTDAGFIKGTPRYLSPEIIARHAPIDRRADLFSLGSVLFELIKVKPLFDAPNLLTLMTRIREADVSEHLKELKKQYPKVAKFMHRVFTTHPDDRFPTGREMGRQLRQLRRELNDEEIDLDVFAQDKISEKEGVAPRPPRKTGRVANLLSGRLGTSRAKAPAKAPLPKMELPGEAQPARKVEHLGPRAQEAQSQDSGSPHIPAQTLRDELHNGPGSTALSPQAESLWPLRGDTRAWSPEKEKDEAPAPAPAPTPAPKQKIDKPASNRPLILPEVHLKTGSIQLENLVGQLGYGSGSSSPDKASQGATASPRSGPPGGDSDSHGDAHRPRPRQARSASSRMEDGIADTTREQASDLSLSGQVVVVRLPGEDDSELLPSPSVDSHQEVNAGPARDVAHYKSAGNVASKPRPAASPAQVRENDDSSDEGECHATISSPPKPAPGPGISDETARQPPLSGIVQVIAPVSDTTSLTQFTDAEITEPPSAREETKSDGHGQKAAKAPARSQQPGPQQPGPQQPGPQQPGPQQPGPQQGKATGAPDAATATYPVEERTDLTPARRGTASEKETRPSDGKSVAKSVGGPTPGSRATAANAPSQARSAEKSSSRPLPEPAAKSSTQRGGVSPSTADRSHRPAPPSGPDAVSLLNNGLPAPRAGSKPGMDKSRPAPGPRQNTPEPIPAIQVTSLLQDHAENRQAPPSAPQSKQSSAASAQAKLAAPTAPPKQVPTAAPPKQVPTAAPQSKQATSATPQAKQTSAPASKAGQRSDSTPQTKQTPPSRHENRRMRHDPDSISTRMIDLRPPQGPKLPPPEEDDDDAQETIRGDAALLSKLGMTPPDSQDVRATFVPGGAAKTRSQSPALRVKTARAFTEEPGGASEAAGNDDRAAASHSLAPGVVEPGRGFKRSPQPGAPSAEHWANKTAATPAAFGEVGAAVTEPDDELPMTVRWEPTVPDVDTSALASGSTDATAVSAPDSAPPTGPTSEAFSAAQSSAVASVDGVDSFGNHVEVFEPTAMHPDALGAASLMGSFPAEGVRFEPSTPGRQQNPPQGKMPSVGQQGQGANPPTSYDSVKQAQTPRLPENVPSPPNSQLEPYSAGGFEVYEPTAMQPEGFGNFATKGAGVESAVTHPSSTGRPQVKGQAPSGSSTCGSHSDNPVSQLEMPLSDSAPEPTAMHPFGYEPTDSAPDALVFNHSDKKEAKDVPIQPKQDWKKADPSAGAYAPEFEKRPGKEGGTDVPPSAPRRPDRRSTELATRLINVSGPDAPKQELSKLDGRSPGPAAPQGSPPPHPQSVPREAQRLGSNGPSSRMKGLTPPPPPGPHGPSHHAGKRGKNNLIRTTLKMFQLAGAMASRDDARDDTTGLASSTADKSADAKQYTEFAPQYSTEDEVRDKQRRFIIIAGIVATTVIAGLMVTLLVI